MCRWLLFRPIIVPHYNAANGPIAERRTSRLSQALLVLLAAYKYLVSPLFTGSCRFLPSCSAYAEEAVRQHGALWGIWLAIWRVARCQPLCTAGLDPVPKTGRPEDS